MKLKKMLTDYIITAFVAILILYFSIAREQSFIKTLPTLITLIVMILLANANRFGFLLGGVNSLLYGLSYFSSGLYFSTVSAVLISAPIQIYSYFNWRRTAKNDRPTIRLLGIRRLLIVIGLTLVGWTLCAVALASFFSSAVYPAVDSFLFVMSITVTLLSARGFVESQYLNLLSCTINLMLWGAFTLRAPSNFNYVIISSYNLFRVAQASFNWTSIYIKDKKTPRRPNSDPLKN